MLNEKFWAIFISKRIMSIPYGRLKITESINLMKTSLDTIVKAMNLDDFIHTKKVFREWWDFFAKQIVYLYEKFEILEDFIEPIAELKKYEAIARTNKNIKKLNFKTGDDLTMICCKPDAVLLAVALLKFQNDSNEIFHWHPLSSVSLRGLTYDCNLFDIKQGENEDLFSNWKWIKRKIVSVHGPRHFKFNTSRVFTHGDVNNLYRLSFRQKMAFVEVMFDEKHLWKQYLQQQMIRKSGF